MDSVVLRVLNIHLYPEFHQWNHQAQYMQTKGLVYEEKPILATFHHTPDMIKMKRIWHKKRIPSSSYDLNYTIDEDQNFCEVNFSLPKYKYGENVFQLLPSVFSKHYNFFECSNWNGSIKHIYRLFRQTIKTALKQLLFRDPPEEDIEFRRIDFAFNRILESNHHVDEYWNSLKFINKRYNARKLDNSKDWLYWVNDNYTFKIYKKGPEFKKHRNKKLLLYDFEGLQNFAYKILRYEKEYRNLGYHFNQYVKDLSFSYRGLISQYNDLVKLEDDKIMLNKTQRNLKKQVSKLMAVAPSIRMKYNTRYQDVMNSNSERVYGMNLEFFTHMYCNFRKEVEGFTLSNRPNMINISDEIDRMHQLNKDLRMPNFNKNIVKSILFHLETYSWDEIQGMSFFPRSTLYRYKALIKKLTGIDNRSFESAYVFETNNDFTTYYNQMIFNNYFIMKPQNISLNILQKF